MIERIISILGKYRDVCLYLFIGGLTTGVNYLVYIPVYNLLHVSAALSNLLAWAAAVVFAYLTNKPFVFHSTDWSVKTVARELPKFIGCRLFSGLLETLILFAAVDLLLLNGNLWKLVTSILVVILNYFTGRLLVFGE